MNLIAAVSENGVIGKRGSLPWHLKDELNRYKEITNGGVLIMGRKTFASIGRPLPNRESWVLTRASEREFTENFPQSFPKNSPQNFPQNSPGRVRIFNSQKAILKACQKERRSIFINGGGEIYKIFLPYCQRLYYTEVHTTIKGDTFFPKIHWDDWELKSLYHQVKNERNLFSWTQRVYQRSALNPSLSPK